MDHGSIDERMMEGLVDNLRIDLPDEEILPVVEQIKAFDLRIRQRVLALCHVLSGASSALVVSALRRMQNAGQSLSFPDLERWIGTCFDLLDARGIDAYISFSSQADHAETLRRFSVRDGVRLESIVLMLETYLRGVSGLELKIVIGHEAYTDTSVIYLPEVIDQFSESERNRAFYKLMVVHKWAQIACGTLIPDDALLLQYVPAGIVHPDLDMFFAQFPEREFACDLYSCIEAVRLDRFMRTELPGLMREGDALRSVLYEMRPSLTEVPEKTGIVEALYQYYLSGEIKGVSKVIDSGMLSEIEHVRFYSTPEHSLGLVRLICERTRSISGPYEPRNCLQLLGAIRADQVALYLKSQRQQRWQRLHGIITKLLDMPGFDPEKLPVAALREEAHREIDPRKEYLVIKGSVVEVDEELQEFLAEDGTIPGGILVKGCDIGGGRAVTLEDLLEEEEIALSRSGGLQYAEWDFRRGGYRKNYCSLYEHDLRPGDDPFVALTRERYRGQIDILRKKFELLRREPRILRNQRDGDHVDIDAAVAAVADMRAGISPGEGLFTRMDRQERNIAVLFLIDMSGSTKGWVNVAEKEALVLLSEALDALGDRYAIYGFSGFTRTKCDFYRIKAFADAYNEAARERIAGVRPMDYTRMGPPIRHALNILRNVEARTKLLIILSDGKPEDWDAYKGEYAIEDTRKAVLEVKECGMHPFCITIDREGHTYLPHLFGSSNYIVIDDVMKLPDRIPEIYRRLTT
jgi:nitric oxide reductase NorD protein